MVWYCNGARPRSDGNSWIALVISLCGLTMVVYGTTENHQYWYCKSVLSQHVGMRQVETPKYMVV